MSLTPGESWSGLTRGLTFCGTTLDFPGYCTILAYRTPGSHNCDPIRPNGLARLPTLERYAAISVGYLRAQQPRQNRVHIDSSRREDAWDDNYQRAVVLWSFVQHFADR